MIDELRHDGMMQQMVHKPAEWIAYERAVVETCCKAWMAGRREFAADDVPVHLRPLSAGLPGNVWHALVRANVLEPVEIGGGQIKRRASKSGTAKARWINCYRLRSYAAGAAWLRDHAGIEIAPQMELAF